MNARPRRRRLAAAFATLALLAACSTDRQAVRDEDSAAQSAEPPPRYESRTGIPVLMDLPLIGWLFRRTTTIR